jgi:hypothetical protein
LSAARDASLLLVKVTEAGRQLSWGNGADRVRLDPLDPKTAHHLGQCEFASGTEAAVLRLALMVQDREGYWWMECSACDSGWQVPRYETVG